MFRIDRAHCGYEAEVLNAPFGFKGKYINSLWQSAVLLEDMDGHTGCAPGVQSVVWSDAAVFEQLGDLGGNDAMFQITRRACEMVQGQCFETPIHMIRSLEEELYVYARRVTRLEDVRPTFVLNALVPLDLAAWQLYARQNAVHTFDDMVPDVFRAALPARHDKLARIPLISYNVGLDSVRELADSGDFLLKIKLGNDPEGDGDREKMLQWDMRRVTQLHEALRERRTPYTENGKLAYYFDANGRYDSRDRLMRLLDHMDHIGALTQTVLLEEPFPENSGIDVHGMGVRVAGDESAHGVRDAQELIALGYGAMALKPIAKTLSVSLEVAKLAHEKGIPCFCADLTVPPVLVDWNKCVAARLNAIPGLKVGALESNGAQNYPDWARLRSYHPLDGKEWIDARQGLFRLDDEFYASSGGVLMDSLHYMKIAGEEKK